MQACLADTGAFIANLNTSLVGKRAHPSASDLKHLGFTVRPHGNTNWTMQESNKLMGFLTAYFKDKSIIVPYSNVITYICHQVFFGARTTSAIKTEFDRLVLADSRLKVLATQGFAAAISAPRRSTNTKAAPRTTPSPGPSPADLLTDSGSDADDVTECTPPTRTPGSSSDDDDSPLSLVMARLHSPSLVMARRLRAHASKSPDV
jgi:hypothetical protein